MAAAQHAGPGLILSFVISGVAVAVAALSYAEFASTIPISGSTYSYSYVALGEIVAWIIGWDLILEYAFAVPTIALGWSGYFVGLLESLGIHIPAWAANSASAAPGGFINLPAMAIILILTGLLYLGTKESATANNIAVILKIFVVFFFIFAAVWHESQQTGFLSYLLVGSPVSFVFSTIGLNWASGIISAGAIAGITTVLLVMLYGSTRIVFAMSRDGLLPSVFSKLHKKHKTPHVSTIIIGLFSSLIAGFFPIGVLAELVNIGTMFAFVIISVAVIIMRYTQPDLPRKFRAPWVPFTPLLAIIFTGFLMSSLPLVTWIRFIVWLLIGFIIYFSYGYKRSRIHEGTEATVQAKRFLNSNRMGAIHRGSHIFRFYLFTRDFFIL